MGSQVEMALASAHPWVVKLVPLAALAEDEIRRRVSRTAGCARCSAHARKRVQIGEDARIARVGDEQVAGGIGCHAARIA